MPLINKVMDDLKIAMREKNKEKLNILRMLNAAFKNKKIDLGNQDELSDEQALGVVKSEVKKRKDSVKAYKDGEREDLAEIEEKEIAILEKYLPAQMSDEDLEKLVAEAINSLPKEERKNIGKIMPLAMAAVKGQADGGRVSAMVKKLNS